MSIRLEGRFDIGCAPPAWEGQWSFISAEADEHPLGFHYTVRV